MRKLQFVDLFAGCGGLSLGLSLAGMRGLFAIERDRFAFETFSANFVANGGPNDYLFEWPEWLEQRPWSIEELLEIHRPKLESLRGAIDILAGGPPCQGFSFAGRRVESDPRNLLFRKYVESVDSMQPRIVVLENVPGMRIAHSQKEADGSPATSSQARRSFYDRLAEDLSDIGYDVGAVLLDACRFGVPQRRSRLIAIGIRKDLSPWLNGGVDRVFELIEECRVQQLRELGLPERISTSDAISDLETLGQDTIACSDPQSPKGFVEVVPRPPRTRYQELMRNRAETSVNSMRLARHHDHVRQRFARILQECRRGVRVEDAALRRYGVKKNRIHPLSATEPAATVTTLPEDILHYSEPRILTVRETARLQSFPDWFQFRGKFTTGGHLRRGECPRYTQVGNAVPPNMSWIIGIALRLALHETRQNIDRAIRMFGLKEEARQGVSQTGP